MFSIALQRKIKVQECKSYPLQFPFKDPSCLTRNTPAMLKVMSKTHEEDAHDDNLIAIETSNQVHTCAQLRAAENAVNSHILETDNLNDNAKSPLDVRNNTPALPAAKEERENATLLPTILPPRISSGDDLAAARPSIEHDRASIYMQTLPITANLRSQKHLQVILEIGLPKHYAPNHLVPEGKMHVVGVKARNISSKKAVSIVKFISPPSLKDVQIHLFCTGGTKDQAGARSQLNHPDSSQNHPLTLQYAASHALTLRAT